MNTRIKKSKRWWKWKWEWKWECKWECKWKWQNINVIKWRWWKWNEDDDETMSQNKIIKELNDHFDEIISKSKSFEEQIKSLKKWEDLKAFWPYNDHDDKELKFKYFKIKLADMLKIIDEKLFETIFGHTLKTLTNKLINTTNKEENQIILNNIHKNKGKLYKQDDFGDWVIQPSDLRIDLNDAIELILDFNEETV